MNEIPPHVEEWIKRQEKPFVLVFRPYQEDLSFLWFDDDPKTVEEVEKTYTKLLSERVVKEMQEKNL